MADFQPLCGIEYNTDIAGDFEELISPPYDVIDRKMRRRFAEKSPYNIVRLILPEPSDGLDRYQAAGRLVKEWLDRGVLVKSGRAFYVLEQRFEMGGAELVRTAIIGRVRLGPWRENGVYPHEVTLPKPKADRLNLYRATRLQPGPVFSLFEDKGAKAAEILRRLKTSPPYRTVRGPEGTTDRVWKITDGKTTAALVKVCAEERFFVADGHHRYETALAYRDEIASRRSLPPQHPANFVLTAAVPFDDPGLVILPTHRLLKFADPDIMAKALRALEEDYLVDNEDNIDEESMASRLPGAIAVYTGGEWYVLRMKEETRESFRKEAGELMAGLNVYEVRKRVLNRFFDDVDEAVASERITYTHDLHDAIRGVDRKTSDAAVILSPLSVRTMAQVARAGRTMPPKSTYFYPKMPTGVVLKPLE